MTPEQAAEVVVDALAGRRSMLVALDGRSGAGTSTLADVLADRLGGAVVRGDDFYRDMPDSERRLLRAEQGYAQFFDWQRLRREALVPLRRGRAARYRPFDWQAGQGLQAGVVAVEPADVVLIDGIYTARPELADLMDLTVLVRTPTKERLRRLRARGHDNETWWPHWEAAEEFYFTHVRPAESFDVVVAGA